MELTSEAIYLISEPKQLMEIALYNNVHNYSNEGNVRSTTFVFENAELSCRAMGCSCDDEAEFAECSDDLQFGCVMLTYTDGHYTGCAVQPEMPMRFPLTHMLVSADLAPFFLPNPPDFIDVDFVTSLATGFDMGADWYQKQTEDFDKYPDVAKLFLLADELSEWDKFQLMASGS